MKRMMTNRSWFDFQPVFPCSSRSPTGIAHAVRVPAKEPGAAAFSAMGGVGLLALLPSPAAEERGAGVHARGSIPRRKTVWTWSIPREFKFLDWAPIRRMEGATKKPGLRRSSAPGLLQTHFR